LPKTACLRWLDLPTFLKYCNIARCWLSLLLFVIADKFRMLWFLVLSQQFYCVKCVIANVALWLELIHQWKYHEYGFVMWITKLFKW
jgi:hypothetical protein